MSAVDWSLLRYLHEVYGTPFEELAEENGTSLRMVKYVAEQQKWRTSQLALSANDWQDVDYQEEDLIEVIQEKLSAVSLLKQNALNPRIQALEFQIVSKASEVVQCIDPESHNAADSILKMTTLLEKLKESNPAIQSHLSKATQVGSGDSSIKIQVVTGFVEKQQDVIEVSAPTLPSIAEAPNLSNAEVNP